MHLAALRRRGYVELLFTKYGVRREKGKKERAATQRMGLSI
jgi:hypothetical protein